MLKRLKDIIKEIKKNDAEKKDIIKSLANSSKDVGSTEIQIGLLTDKIFKLSEHFKKFKKRQTFFSWVDKISK